MPVTQDFLLGNRVQLTQPQKGLRATLDTVLLAASIHAGPRELLVELGTGTGAAALCVAARLAGCRILGLEREESLNALAQQNIAANNQEGRILCLPADIEHLPRSLPAPFAYGQCHQVFANPPFYAAGAHRPSKDETRRSAMHDAGTGLRPWARAAKKLLRAGGRFTIIHEAAQLDALLADLRAASFGSFQIIPLWPKAGRAAKRVLIQARLLGKSPLILQPGFALHTEKERYSDIVESLLTAENIKLFN